MLKKITFQIKISNVIDIQSRKLSSLGDVSKQLTIELLPTQGVPLICILAKSGIFCNLNLNNYVKVPYAKDFVHSNLPRIKSIKNIKFL